MYSVTHPTFKVFTIPWDPNNPEKLHGDSGSNVSAGSFFSRYFWSFRNLQVAIIVAARHAEFTHIADTCWTANRAVGCYYLMAIDWGNPPSKKKPEQFGFWAEMELSQPKKSKNIDMWYIIFKGIIKYITSTIQIPTPVPVKRTWIWGLDQCCNWIIQIFKGCLPFSGIHVSCSAGKKMVQRLPHFNMTPWSDQHIYLYLMLQAQRTAGIWSCITIKCQWHCGSDSHLEKLRVGGRMKWEFSNRTEKPWKIMETFPSTGKPWKNGRLKWHRIFPTLPEDTHFFTTKARRSTHSLLFELRPTPLTKTKV